MNKLPTDAAFDWDEPIGGGPTPEPKPEPAPTPAPVPSVEPGESVERALIGALVQEPDAVLPIVEAAGLTAASFTDPVCLRAWGAIARLRAKKRAVVDLLTVPAEMDGDAGTNMVELGACVSLCPTVAHAEHYARQVAEAELRRKLSDAARMAADALAKGGAVEVIATQLKAAGEAAEGGARIGGPLIVSAADFLEVKRPEPPQIVQGVLRAGQIAMLSAASKAGKSWYLLGLAIAVSAGREWLGNKTTQGRVLYINAELSDYDLEIRLRTLVGAMGLVGVPDGLDVWHMRGQSMTIPQLLPAILRRQRERGLYSLILPDPLYRFGQGRDENDNAVQAITMGELGEVAERTAAAVLAAHHFSKGNKAGTDHLDRASGAGMFARAPDSILTLTAHEEPDCYTLENTVRGFAKPAPVVVRWKYPLWTVADELDPERLKRPAGRPARFNKDDLLDLLPSDGLSHGDWMKRAKEETGMGKTRFNELLRMAKGGGEVVLACGKYIRGSVE